MAAIDLLVTARDARRLHGVLAERLAAMGHDVALVAAPGLATPRALDAILALERRVFRVRDHDPTRRVDARLLPAPRPEATLRIDLTGERETWPSPTLSLRFGGSAHFADAARSLMRGGLPDLAVVLDGATVLARGAPMVDSRTSTLRGLKDVLARAVSLLARTGDRVARGVCRAPQRPDPMPAWSASPTGGEALRAYLGSALPRVGRRALGRLGVDANRWAVRYRFGAPSVSQTGLLSGAPWRTVPDEKTRFFADPFPFERDGRFYLFMEDFPNGAPHAVLSVVEVFADREPSPPRVVVREPYHLSYPQVFAHAGEVWMLPEGGAGRELVLYRAAEFPMRWERHAVLIANRELFDATLLEHDGRFWLFAAERDGCGSASDTLVVFHAPALLGPWTPHRNNPQRVDRAAARPGGAFKRVAGRVVLPLQNGTRTYGGGLGLATLLRLDEDVVRLSEPVPLLDGAMADPYPAVHTLNECAGLEAIDVIAPVRRAALKRGL